MADRTSLSDEWARTGARQVVENGHVGRKERGWEVVEREERGAGDLGTIDDGRRWFQDSTLEHHSDELRRFMPGGRTRYLRCRVAVDTQDPGDRNPTAGLLFKLAFGAVLPCLAGFEVTTWNGPTTVACTENEKDVTRFVASRNARCSHNPHANIMASGTPRLPPVCAEAGAR